MTQMLTVSVEYEELMARADELEAVVPGLPVGKPQSPCLLRNVLESTEQLGMSADNVRLYLQTGIEREWKKLAENLRTAAKAYQQVDEDSASIMNYLDDRPSASAATPSSSYGDLDTVVLTNTPTVQSLPPEWEDLKQRAWNLESTDRGASLDAFADAWAAYRLTLQQETYRFRPFNYYDGEAAASFEKAMDDQRQWLIKIADSCYEMANQARAIASTQRWALPNHILWHEGKLVDYNYLVGFEEQYNRYPEQRYEYEKYYAEWQVISDDVMAEYESRANLPLTAINPSAPPYVQKATVPGDYNGELPTPEPNNQWPWDQGLLDQGGMGGGMPTGGTPEPEMPIDEELTDMPIDASATSGLSGGSGGGVKPASFAGGVPAAPAPPLQPPVDGGAAARPAAASIAGVPGMPSRLGGGAGAGMGGMGGMGAGGGQGENGKGKRVKGDSEYALYIEKRPWTSGIIGNRRRNDGHEGEG